MSLRFEETDLPEISRSKKGYQPNEYDEAVRTSFSNGKAFAVTFPVTGQTPTGEPDYEAVVKVQRTKLVYTTRHYGYGLKLRSENGKDKTGKPVVRITFQAAEKRTYNTKSSADK